MTFASFLVAMGATPQGGVNPLVQFIPFALVLAIFYFVILLPMKRRQQKVQDFLSTLKVGDRVVTSGGIYGSITKLGDQAVQIQIPTRSASTCRATPSSAIRGRSRSRRRGSRNRRAGAMRCGHARGIPGVSRQFGPTRADI